MILAILFIFICMWLTLSRAAHKHDSYLSPVTIVGYSILFYAIAIPMELSLRPDKTIGFTHLVMNDETGWRIAVLACFGYASFSLAYLWLASRGTSIHDFAWRNSGPHNVRRTVGVLCCLAAATLVVFHWQNLLAAADYQTNVAQTAAEGGNSGYFLLNRATYLLYGMYVVIHTMQNEAKPSHVALRVAPLVAWSIYSNDKDPIVVALLAFASLLLARTNRSAPNPLRWLAVTSASVIATTVGAAAFGANRANVDVVHALKSLGRDGIFINIDPAGPALVNTVSLEQGLTYHAGTLCSSLFLWVPRLFWPVARPLDHAETFARAYYPFYRPGYGYGFSPIAEGLATFGVLGVPVVFALLGLLLGLARNLLLKSRHRTLDSQIIAGAGFIVLLGYVSFVSMRGSLASAVTTSVHLSVLLVAVLAVHSAVRRRRRP